MRVFILITFIVFPLCLSEGAEDNDFDVLFYSHVIHRRAAANSTLPFTVPDTKTALSTAAAVFTTLGDTKNAQKFGERFLNIKPLRMVQALKGFSIASSLLFAILDIPDPETEKILNSMNTQFDKMSKKMDSQTVTLKAYIDKKFLNTFISVPVKASYEAMQTYKNKKNAANKKAFLDSVDNANLPEVVNRILADAKDVIRNIMVESHYNETQMEAMNTLLLLNFHEAFLVMGCHIGLTFKGKNLVDADKSQGNFFNKSFKAYKKISDEVFADLKSEFFPGFIEDDYVKPAIDNNNVNNCDLAESILKPLNTNFPWRRCVVIVSDNDIGSAGFPARRIVTKGYNGKTVLVFLATKDFDKTKYQFLASGEKDVILKKLRTESSMPNYGNFDDLTVKSKNATAYYQLAATNLGYCLRAITPNVHEEFPGKYYVSPFQLNPWDCSVIAIF